MQSGKSILVSDNNFFFISIHYTKSIIAHNVASYRPQRSCEGYVFTGVCLSTGGVGVSASVHAGIPPPQADTFQSRHTPPPEQTPPQSRHPQSTPPGTDTPSRADTPRSRHPPPRDMATAVDGTHPTGMHSCYFNQLCL